MIDVSEGSGWVFMNAMLNVVGIGAALVVTAAVAVLPSLVVAITLVGDTVGRERGFEAAVDATSEDFCAL